MKASRFIKGDYRKHAPLTARPTTRNVLGKKEGYPEASDGKNRHDRRADRHFQGIRKNTLGVPLGFNVLTWNSRCQDVAMFQRESDASKGKPYVSPGKQKRYARSTDILKGVPGASRFRDMVRKNGLQETIMLMHGYNRGVKRHPGYPTMGNYDKTGGCLAGPSKAK